jgi:hypothetical protein
MGIAKDAVFEIVEPSVVSSIHQFVHQRYAFFLQSALSARGIDTIRVAYLSQIDSDEVLDARFQI